MKLVVRVLSDLVGGQDSVAEPGGTAFGKEDMHGCRTIIFVPWKKNRDPSHQADVSFFEIQKMYLDRRFCVTQIMLCRKAGLLFLQCELQKEQGQGKIGLERNKPDKK